VGSLLCVCVCFVCVVVVVWLWLWRECVVSVEREVGENKAVRCVCVCVMREGVKVSSGLVCE
jgi:hypothetical protein